MDNKTAIYQTIKDAREYLKLFKLGLDVRTSEDDIFEMKSPDGEISKIKGSDIIAELSGKSKEATKSIHHTAKR